MATKNSPRPSDSWMHSPEALLESYRDRNFSGDKLARDQSIEFLTGTVQLNAFLAAIAVLSLEARAFDTNTKNKRMDFAKTSPGQPLGIDKELEYFQELQARLQTLIMLQVSAIHRNINIPNRDSYSDLVEQTKDCLLETAVILGEESLIRILTKQQFNSFDRDDNKKALLLRLQRLFPDSEDIAETILELATKKDFEFLNPLDLLEEFFGNDSKFERVVVTNVLSDFESYLPRNYNDLDQALLLRFLAARMSVEHEDEIYDRFLKLDLPGDEELECVILDRKAVLRIERFEANAAKLTAQFRDQLDELSTIPEGWEFGK